MINYSIIIPIYNMEKYLEECLDSILQSKRDDIEIILVNDGSSDGTIDICNRYQKKYNNIIVVDKKNTGSMDSWILGVKKSTGKYIGFVDSDDKISKDYFEVLDNYINKNFDIICFDFYKYYLNKIVPVKKNNIPYGEGDLDAIKYSYFSNYESFTLYRWDKIIKASLIKENIKDIDYRVTYFEDIPISLKNIISTKKIFYVNKNLYYYRIRQSSVTHKIKGKMFEDLAIVEKKTTSFLKENFYSDFELKMCKSYFDYQFASNFLKCDKYKKRRKITMDDICLQKGLNKKLTILLYKFRLNWFYNFLYKNLKSNDKKYTLYE